MNSRYNFNFFQKVFAVNFSLLLFFSFTGNNAEAPSKTIILIPYQKIMHLSDADEDIADNSKINVRLVKLLMRNSVTEQITFALRDQIGVRLLSETGTSRERDDLDNFLSSEILFLSDSDSVNPSLTADTSNGSNPYFNVFRKNKSPDYNSSFMNVSLSKPVLFQKLSNDYDTDYFLVLTQLEIKTHYNDCIDIANKIYRREFRLHYAFFDAAGNLARGGYVSAYAGSDMNSITRITGNVFPELVKKVSDKVKTLIK